jgi:hypothetical protein
MEVQLFFELLNVELSEALERLEHWNVWNSPRLWKHGSLAGLNLLWKSWRVRG